MIGEESRWNRSAIVHLRDKLGQPLRRPYLDLLDRYDDIRRASNRRYRIRDTDEWHRMAWKMLGRGSRFWILLEFNEIIDPFTELEPEKVINVPTRDVTAFDVLDFEIEDVDEGVFQL